MNPASKPSRRLLYAAGVFALFCFSLLELIAPLRAADLFEVYGRFLLAALFGAFLLRAAPTKEWAVRVYLAYLLWLLLTRWLNGDFYLFIDRELMRTEVLSFVLFSLGVLLSSLGRRRFLTALAIFYGGFFALFSLLGLFVAVTNTYIHVPPENVWITLRTDGNAFNLLNLLSSFRLVTAARLYISWMLLLWLLLKTKRKLLWVPLLIGMLALHGAIALCFSRTIRISFGLTCAMLAMLLCWRYLPVKKLALRILALAAAFALAFPLGYKSFDVSALALGTAQASLTPRFAAYYESLEHKPDPDYFGIAAQQEIDPERVTVTGSAEGADGFSDARTVGHDFTLGFRTRIWESAVVTAFQNPRILFCGQSSKTLTKLADAYMKRVYNWTTGPNMHNYLFQVLQLAGLPGFLLVLAWSLLLIVKMVRAFFSPRGKLPFSTVFLTIPLTGMFVFCSMEYELFPAWDSSTRVFLLLLGLFLGLYREAYPAA